MQARTQFSLWALFPAPLLISQDVLRWSAYAEETYQNTAVTAINQDRLGRAAVRLQGGNLSFPCTDSKKTAAASTATTASCTNVWGRTLSGDRLSFVFVNNGARAANVTCGPACFGQLAMPAQAYQIQDVWDLTPIPPNIQRGAAGFSHTATVPGQGGSRMFELMAAG